MLNIVTFHCNTNKLPFTTVQGMGIEALHEHFMSVKMPLACNLHAWNEYVKKQVHVKNTCKFSESARKTFHAEIDGKLINCMCR